VNGNQGSVDYTLQGFPEVGEIPYSCVWTARGKLLPGDDPATETEATYVMWTKPERLTSGARDANLPAVDCVKDAGCILTWQEDPEGVRPGQGSAQARAGPAPSPTARPISGTRISATRTLTLCSPMQKDTVKCTSRWPVASLS
jgi:hypothetical protein